MSVEPNYTSINEVNKESSYIFIYCVQLRLTEHVHWCSNYSTQFKNHQCPLHLQSSCNNLKSTFMLHI